MKASSQAPRGGDGPDLRELGETFGTPLYVISLDRIRTAATDLGQAFAPAGVELLYSLKTNYLPEIVTTMAQLGLGVDVVSGYELRLALDCGLPGKRIVFNGPVKTPEELALAVRNGVQVNVDGLEEIEILAHLAVRRGPIPVGLRVYPPDNVFAGAGRPSTRSLPSKFGWPIDDGSADDVARKIIGHPGLHLTGVHCHLGSQIVSTQSLLTALDTLCRWVAKLRTRTELTILNIGGGFVVEGIHRIPGVAASLSTVAATERPGGLPLDRELFDAEQFGLRLAEILAEHDLDDLRIQAEPGRALVSAAGVLLTRVVGRKELPGHRWIVLDGGLNLLPTAGAGEIHRITTLIDDPGPGRPCLVGGPLCYEGDVFGANIELPEALAVGDFVAIEDAGAYSFSRATSFNRLRPATVTVSDGIARMAWRAETYEDLMSLRTSEGVVV